MPPQACPKMPRQTAPRLPLWLPALLLLLAAAPTPAGIDPSGSVNPSPPVNGADLVVGDAAASTPVPLGVLVVDGGSMPDYDSLVIGDEEDFIGDVTITGSGTSVELTDSGSSPPALQVGNDGTGLLTVSAGAVLNVSSNSGAMVIGRDATGSGNAVIEGRLSQLIVGDDIIVGDEGSGELIIRDGAFAYYTDGVAGTFVLGNQSGGVGFVEVTGERTFLVLPQTTTVGAAGSAIFRIGTGATVDANNDVGTTQTFTIGATGEVEMRGGSLQVETLANNGRLEGHGDVDGPITNAPGGEIAAAAGDTLILFGAVANTGLVAVAGDAEERAEIDFRGALTNTDPGGSALPGRIAVGNGVIRFSSTLTNDGTLASTSGAADFHGEITNGAAGVIAVGGQSNATFFDNVNVTAGTLNIAAGSTALFLGDITISAGVNLSVALDLPADGSVAAAPIQVSGETTLDSQVSLSLADGFVPSEGDVFPLIEAAGGLTVGVIDPNNFDPLPANLAWDIQITSTSLNAVVVPGGIDPGGLVEGDYNGDGFVDAQDYLTWRGEFGQTSNLQADGNGDGVVNAADYTIWRDNLGQGAPPLAGAAPPAPEPAGVLLFAAMAAMTVAWRAHPRAA